MTITRDKIENNQIWIYVISLILGGALGLTNKDVGSHLDWTISPLIAILMFGMFTQIPFLKLREAILNLKFMGA